jgi:hypothetical protein
MKKILFAFASLALIQSAAAQDGADIKWNAEMRFRFTDTENTPVAKSAYDNETVQRTKIGATFTKGEDLTATVTLLNAATWGNAGTTNTSGSLTSDTLESVTFVYEAFAFWKAMDNFALKIGRGALDLADGSVVSKNDWQQTPYAFEGASGVYFTDWANINIFGVKGMNDGIDAGPDGILGTADDVANTADVNFYGASLDFKNLPEAIKMLNFHIMESKATGIDGAPFLGPEVKDSKMRMGVTVKGDISAFDYRATYAMYTGEREDAGVTVDNKASMLDAEVGFALPDMMNMRLNVGYHTDSGDDDLATGDVKSYDPFFYEKHANAGLMDVVGWGNSTYIKAGVALEPMEMTKVGVDYYMFTKTEKNDFIYNDAHTNALGGITNTADDDVGSEIDVWATKALSNGAELNGRIGMFNAGKAWGTTNEDVTDFSLGATFHF